MAGRIPQDFIDELVSRVDIVDVIDQRVPLKKAGREYSACCPFHDEKTPSFTVSPGKQFYHCFGCGAHGTVLGFLMEYDHLDFVEAVEELAHREGLEVPREGAPTGERRDNHKPLYEALAEANRFFRTQLRRHPKADRAVAYLKHRGLSGEVARDFGIGYAPPDWHEVHKALGGDDKRDRTLVSAGLLIEKEDGRRYDRFRDRITFPIRDQRGRVIGFGGRVLGDDKPKYLNSPESPVFHKGTELYGLFEAKQALRSIRRLLVVEGYMDVVALAQYGIRYAVATLGTAVTPEHLKRLFRACSEVVFCFDGDRAGRDAAWRGLENALPLMQGGRQVRFMFLPEGEDPDSLVRREGPDGFEQHLERAVPLSEFLLQRLEEQTDMATLDGRARLVELAKPLLERLPAGPFRQLMTESVGRRAGLETTVTPGTGRTAVGGAPKAIGTPPVRRPRRRGSSAAGLSPVRRAIQMLVQQPALARTVEELTEFKYLDAPGKQLLLELLKLLHARPHLNTAALLEHWRGREEERHLLRLAEQEPVLGDTGQLESEFQATLELLRRKSTEARRTARLRELQARFPHLSAAEKDELKALVAKADNGS